MLRVRTLHIVATACAGGGLACYLLTAARGGTAGLAAQWAAPAFFAMSAAAAWAASYRFRLNCRDLARQLQAGPSSPPATVVPTPPALPAVTMRAASTPRKPMPSANEPAAMA